MCFVLWDLEDCLLTSHTHHSFKPRNRSWTLWRRTRKHRNSSVECRHPTFRKHIQLAKELGISIKIDRYDGLCVLHTAHIEDSLSAETQNGRWRLRCEIPPHALNVGRYFITVAADIPYKRILVMEEHVLAFQVGTLSSRMGRYGFDGWTGTLGPFIADWTRSDSA